MREGTVRPEMAGRVEELRRRANARRPLFPEAPKNGTSVPKARPGGGLGARLAGLRESRGLTRKQLARRAHVSDRAVRYLERGERHPTLDVAANLASALGCTLDQLAGRAAG
jgi:DNA-binding XRE family transcriptional regulator